MSAKATKLTASSRSATFSRFLRTSLAMVYRAFLLRAGALYAQLHWSTLFTSDQPWPWGCGFCSAICSPSRT